MTQAQTGQTVKVHYTGSLDSGTVFDSSREREPLEFIIGSGRIIPGFEQAVVGMGPGEEKTFTIPADEAYGPHRDELVMEIARAQLPAEAKPTVGQRYTVRGDNGQVTEFTLTSLSDTTATFDGNHPLAGHDLTFNIQLVEIV